MWTDTRYIYVELPTAAGLLPLHSFLPFREQGLSCALDLFRTTTDTAGFPSFHLSQGPQLVNHPPRPLD